MPVLYVTSDRPGAGRTALASGLARLLGASGRPVALAKPLALAGEGSAPTDDADVRFFNEAVLPGGRASQPLWLSPEDAAQPFLQERLRRVAREVQAAASDGHTVVVEGLPLSDSQGQPVPAAVALAEALDARAMVVVGYRSSLDAAALADLARPIQGRLLGAVVNGFTRYQVHDTHTRLVPGLETQGLRVLGTIPEDRTLLGVTVAQVAERLRATWLLNEDHAGNLVEHILIGGFMLDWGRLYFGRKPNKAVICRMDRPDIQMAALRSGTPTACLILTAGQERIAYDFPVQYVRHEALWLEVPVLLASAGTLDTAYALDCLVSEAAFHHAQKLERYQQVLRERLNLEAVTGAA